MELSPRKQAVLAAVTSAYIKTGEPIGSKALTTVLKNAPSSATLRNEMNELCELGLLTQPHTSAGRIPSANRQAISPPSAKLPTYRLSTTKASTPTASEQRGPAAVIITPFGIRIRSREREYLLDDPSITLEEAARQIAGELHG